MSVELIIYSALAMNCLGLASSWEKCDELRARLREKKVLLVHSETEQFCLPTRTNAVNNAIVLEPVLTRLKKAKKQRLPHLENLKVEVTTLFEKCGLSLGETDIYRTSVEIKKLAGFIKRRVNRKEITKERVPNHKMKLCFFLR